MIPVDPPYCDPTWLPASQVDCYRAGWDAARQALLKAQEIAVCANCMRQATFGVRVCAVCHSEARCRVVAAVPSSPVADSPVRERPIQQLRDVLSMLCHFVWHRQTRPGDHMWSIPVNKERDFDCILSDAIDELEHRRRENIERNAIAPPAGDHR